MRVRLAFFASLFLFAGLLPAQNSSPKVVHVFVALCDNVHQGIVPVPAHLGHGDQPATNLYWGAAFGVRTFFRKLADWKEVSVGQGPKQQILQRVVFRHHTQNAFIVADAYNGAAMRDTIADFLNAAAGHNAETILVQRNEQQWQVNAGGAAGLVVFVGHNGLMDFTLENTPRPSSAQAAGREAIVLACASKAYFQQALQQTSAKPLLWTTGLMAPEAYTLAAAIDGWLGGETRSQIRARAASAYCQYQKCSQKAGLRLFATD